MELINFWLTHPECQTRQEIAENMNLIVLVSILIFYVVGNFIKK